MIDMVHNEATGFCVVHDEPDLDAVSALVVDETGFCSFVREGAVKRSTRRLPDELLAAARWMTSCAMIRMDGNRPVSERTVRVRHGNPG